MESIGLQKPENLLFFLGREAYSALAVILANCQCLPNAFFALWWHLMRAWSGEADPRPTQ